MSNNNFQKETRSGVDWYIAYSESKYGEMPIAGYVFDKVTGAQECVIMHNPDTPAMFGEFYLSAPDGVHSTFPTFDEALDAANACIAWMDPSGKRFAQHELTGVGGIYRVGEREGAEVIVNAFWSEECPGYVNCSVFVVGKGEQFDILTSAYCNGYLSIEDCVRDLACDFASGDDPDIARIADCGYEFSTITEFREVLEGGKLDHPEPLLPHDDAQIELSMDELKQQAKEKAAEKNHERPTKNHSGKDSPEL